MPILADGLDLVSIQLLLSRDCISEIEGVRRAKIVLRRPTYTQDI